MPKGMSHFCKYVYGLGLREWCEGVVKIAQGYWNH